MMEQQGVALGGEQSGSIVFLEHMPTADGLLTALQLLDVLCSTGKKVSELAAAVTRYPQVLMNVPGPADNGEKRRFLDSDGLLSAVSEAERLLGGNGRVLVRASASEPVIRVLVEAPTGVQAEELARNLTETIERLTKKGSS
jgi:phosphoglucosamine mutase